MEESKLQALADSLSKHGGRKGLGTSGGQYSWAKTQVDVAKKSERDDGLPNNALYSGFVKAGSYDPNAKVDDGDGRIIKRDFSDIPVLVEDGSSEDSSKKNKAKKSKNMEPESKPVNKEKNSKKRQKTDGEEVKRSKNKSKKSKR